jgi:hypothetical protein
VQLSAQRRGHQRLAASGDNAFRKALYFSRLQFLPHWTVQKAVLAEKSIKNHTLFFAVLGYID